MADEVSPSNEDQRVLAIAEMADLWVLQPTPAHQPGWLGSSVAWPGYRWLVRGGQDGRPAVVVADLDFETDDDRVRAGRARGRPWRQHQRRLRLAGG